MKVLSVLIYFIYSFICFSIYERYCFQYLMYTLLSYTNFIFLLNQKTIINMRVSFIHTYNYFIPCWHWLPRGHWNVAKDEPLMAQVSHYFGFEWIIVASKQNWAIFEPLDLYFEPLLKYFKIWNILASFVYN